MTIKHQLGKRIRELRTKNGFTQEKLAEKVGIDTKHQSCVENGKNFPSADLIERYAKVFKMGANELLIITHQKTAKELLSEINGILKNADENQIRLAYKVFTAILR